ncbi:MAG: DsbC family protein [Gallionella sp.]
MKSKKFLLTLLIAAFATNVCAATSESESSEITEITATLKMNYPSTQIDSVRATSISGIYEVVMGKNIGYTNAEGRYFLFGHLFDMRTQQDLTQTVLDKLNTIKFADLPLKDAVKTIHGKGERVVAVFSDPDCPYCKKLEGELAALKNVTLYTFLMPLEGLHPQAVAKAKAIWCSKNPNATMHNYMVEGIQPSDKTDCSNPIERNILLGQKLNINGTPTLVFANGSVVPGAASVAQIEQQLDDKGGK